MKTALPLFLLTLFLAACLYIGLYLFTAKIQPLTSTKGFRFNASGEVERVIEYRSPWLPKDGAR